MDILFNNGPAPAQTPHADAGEASTTTLPAVDVSSVRSAAMGAASAAPVAEAQHASMPASRPEVIRIILGPDAPFGAAYGPFNGGRGVPFTAQELRDALTILDALSRFGDQGGMGLGGVRMGDFRHHGGINNQRHAQQVGPHALFRVDERSASAVTHGHGSRDQDRGRDATSSSKQDSARASIERPTAEKPITRTEQLKERIERALEKVDLKPTDLPTAPTVERPIISVERAPKGDQPAIVATPTLATPEIGRPSEVARPTENQQPLKERERDNSALVTAAIRDILNDTRNETARLVAQVLATEPLLRQQTDTTPSVDTRPTTFSNPFEARERVHEKLSQVRDTLQSALERSSPVSITLERPSAPPSYSTAATAPGDFTRVDVPQRHAQPSNTIAAEGRSTPDRLVMDPSSPHAKGGPSTRVDADGRINAPVGTNTATGPQALRAAGAGESTAVFAPLEKGITLVDALSRSTQRVLNFEILHKLERALDTIAITGAAAVALGVLGGEAILTKLTALSKELLARLREDGPFTQEQETEHQTIEEMIKDLEATCRDRGIEKTERPAGFVADITGVITSSGNGLPIEGVVVDAGSLGSTITDTFGEFRFSNVPLETGFTLTCHDHRYSFFPNPVIGTVSTMNHFTIQGTKLS